MFSRISLVLFSASLVGVVHAAEEVIATINGTKITKQQVETAAKLSNSDPRNVVGELIRIELLYQEGKRNKLDKDPDVAFMAELQRKQTIANAMLRQSDVGKPVPDSEIQKFYDDNVKTQNFTEYKLRHILLKTEDDAKAVIADLDKGGNFEDLAKSKSTDPNGKDGGDLDWLTAAKMPKEMFPVVSNMSKGSYTRTPVQTRFGWHVLKLEDSRAGTPPTLDQIKQQIVGAIQNKRMQDYLQTLEKKSKIDIPGAKKPDAPAAKPADTKKN